MRRLMMLYAVASLVLLPACGKSDGEKEKPAPSPAVPPAEPTPVPVPAKPTLGEEERKIQEMIAKRRAAIKEGKSGTWHIKVRSVEKAKDRAALVVEVDLTYLGRAGRIRAPAVSLTDEKGSAIRLASVTHEVLYIPEGGQVTGAQLDEERTAMNEWLVSGKSAKPRSLKLSTNVSQPAFFFSFPVTGTETGLSLRFGDVPPIPIVPR